MLPAFWGQRFKGLMRIQGMGRLGRVVIGAPVTSLILCNSDTVSRRFKLRPWYHFNPTSPFVRKPGSPTLKIIGLIITPLITQRSIIRCNVMV